MSFPFSRLSFTSSKPLTAAVLGVSLVGTGAAIYLSPSTGSGAHDARQAPPSTGSAAPQQPDEWSAAPRPSATPSSAPATPSSGPVTSGYLPQPAKTDYVVVNHAAAIVTATGASRPTHCWDFTWQQDAQTAYRANLSDPSGLDGAPGPHNGDGLACTQLPVDPRRASSRPIDAYVPPSPAQKAALLAPVKRYFGIAADGLPGDAPLLTRITRQAGKAPSSVEWFGYWDASYPAAKVRAAWAGRALPVLTWMSVANDPSTPDHSSYTLANIVAGKFDAYLLKFAGAVLKTGLPVALRFDQEMNGNWYSWSGGMPANQPSDASQPNLYVQAWRHVWNLFDSVGANADVLWLWSPTRVDPIVPHSDVSGLKYETSLAEDYPGDRYVDWVGMSAYQYKPSDGWTYETTFRKTLSGLGSLTTKPIFVAETGATEKVGDTDYATHKAQWIAQTLTGLATEPGVVGFSYFDNNVNDVHTVDGQLIHTNWTIQSSPQSLAAFRSGIANRAYASGLLPDGYGG
jgi:mannan endo-1,4-beta-mannosidase